MSCKLSTAALALLVTVGTAHAGPEWVEGGPEGVLGDAGSLPGSAQATEGDGQLGSIQGSLEGFGLAVNGVGDFEDMYVFEIADPGQWFVSTLPQDGGFSEFNPSLWLFELNGLGLLGNEFFPSIGLIGPGGGGPAGGPPNLGDAKLVSVSDDGVTVIDRAGLYLLAITETGNVPFSEGGPMFEFSFDNEVSGNDGPGGNLPITVWSNNLITGPPAAGPGGLSMPVPQFDWNAAPSTGGPGDYVIALVSSGFAEPEGGACCIGFECVTTANEDECTAQGGVYQGDSSDCGSVICLFCPIVIDFETEDDFATPLVNGQDVSTPPEFGNLIAVNAPIGFNLGPAIFDSNVGGGNDPGPDDDLLVDLGNILILQSATAPTQTVPGFFDEPNDAAVGGAVSFQFAAPSQILSIDLIDICLANQQDATVLLIDGYGLNRVYDVNAGFTTDVRFEGTGYGTLDLTVLGEQPGVHASAFGTETAGFNPTAVVTMVVIFDGSGALDNIAFCPFIDPW